MRTTTLTFLERLDEMRAIGLPDWQIAKRLNITYSSLLREMADERRMT